MRRLLPALCAWLTVALAQAQQPPAPPERNGYAFDTPRILAQQRLFGIAHGVALLADACRALPAFASASESAYALWRMREDAAIKSATHDLDDYYFGNDGGGEQALAQKMSLKDTLDAAADAEQLQSACASLPEALQQPRYDLAERFRLEELMARAVEATETEARERHCRKLFSAQLLDVHDARYELWREINLPVLAEGNKALAEAWPADAPAASFDEWYAGLRRDTQAGGNLAECVAFSESLKRPEAALRNVFRMPAPLSQSKNPP
jgi:hypothetical protein